MKPLRPGVRVMLISTADPHTSKTYGATGTVTRIDSLGTCHVRWDDGSHLGLVPGEDRWVVIDEPAD